jgi:hypothetical protein
MDYVKRNCGAVLGRDGLRMDRKAQTWAVPRVVIGG